MRAFPARLAASPSAGRPEGIQQDYKLGPGMIAMSGDGLLERNGAVEESDGKADADGSALIAAVLALEIGGFQVNSSTATNRHTLDMIYFQYTHC